MAMAMASPVLALLVAMTAISGAYAWSASCADPYFKGCYGVVHRCPPGCPKTCEVDCRYCKPVCACDKPGAVCQDPRFIGGDGIMFYFHGKKDKDFCLVSDGDLHINAHFIGKSKEGGLKRDFTWVQALGIRFGSHKLYIGAKKVGVWDDKVDQTMIIFDDEPLAITSQKGAIWKAQNKGLMISRTTDANAISVELEDVFKIIVRVVPISKEESRVHNYGISDEDCFAHLEINFKFYSLSNEAHGVLGQTYVPGFKSPVKLGVAMPVMGGDEKYATASLFSTDCEVSRFGKPSSGMIAQALLNMDCTSGLGGVRGMVCRR